MTKKLMIMAAGTGGKTGRVCAKPEDASPTSAMPPITTDKVSRISPTRFAIRSLPAARL